MVAPGAVLKTAVSALFVVGLTELPGTLGFHVPVAQVVPLTYVAVICAKADDPVKSANRAKAIVKRESNFIIVLIGLVGLAEVYAWL